METCSLRLVLVLVKFLPSGFGQNVLAFKRDLYWWWFVGDFGSLGGSKKPTKKPLRSPQVWSRFGEPKFAGVSPSCAWGVRWGTLATAPGGTLVLFLCNFFGCIKDRREQKKRSQFTSPWCIFLILTQVVAIVKECYHLNLGELRVGIVVGWFSFLLFPGKELWFLKFWNHSVANLQWSYLLVMFSILCGKNSLSGASASLFDVLSLFVNQGHG